MTYLYRDFWPYALIAVGILMIAAWMFATGEHCPPPRIRRAWGVTLTAAVVLAIAAILLASLTGCSDRVGLLRAMNPFKGFGMGPMHNTEDSWEDSITRTNL